MDRQAMLEEALETLVADLQMEIRLSPNAEVFEASIKIGEDVWGIELYKVLFVEAEPDGNGWGPTA